MNRTLRNALVVVVIVAAVAFILSRRGRNGSDGPFAGEVADAIPRIEQSTGLKFKRPPKVEVRTREQVRDFLIKKFDEATPASEIKGEEAAYKLLGMLPDTLDLRKFYLAVLTEQVVGYYDPATKVLYVVNGTDDKMVGITITHELVHALQDQYVNLDSIQKQTSDNDRASTAQALIEGQAMYEQMSIMAGGRGNIALSVGGRDALRQMIRDAQSSQPVFATAPMVIQESLLFPYLTGADFVQRFKDLKKSSNLFTDGPRSTEQLLHSDAYFTKVDEPSDITLPAPRGATKVYENNLGEFGVRLFLFQQLRDETLAARAAGGWDGDRYLVAEGAAGKGIMWASVWDSTIDAAEFSDALIRATDKRVNLKERSEPGGGATFRPKGRTVTIVPRIVNGRAVVLYTDVPDGMSGVFDAAGIKVNPR